MLPGYIYCFSRYLSYIVIRFSDFFQYQPVNAFFQRKPLSFLRRRTIYGFHSHPFRHKEFCRTVKRDFRFIQDMFSFKFPSAPVQAGCRSILAFYPLEAFIRAGSQHCLFKACRTLIRRNPADAPVNPLGYSAIGIMVQAVHSRIAYFSVGQHRIPSFPRQWLRPYSLRTASSGNPP